MPRFARFHVTGGFFHVISRFHDRRFYLDIDGAREKYLTLLGRAAETHDSRIIAFCLMSSHIHLVLQLGNDPLGRLTKQIHAPFGNWINSQRKGLGTILSDRPKSVLVHSETHGMELILYVHNNPVRAGVVARASESGWSSHQAYLGLAPSPPWLVTEAVLGPDAAAHESIRQELSRFVDEGREEGRRPEFSGEVSKKLMRRMRKLMGGDIELSYPVLGPDEFVVNALKEQVRRHRERKTGFAREISVDDVVEAVFEGMGLDPQLARMRIKPSNVARGRALAAWLWVDRLGRPQVMAADGLGVRPNTISGMLSQLRRDGIDRSEHRLLEKVFKSLTQGEGDSDASEGTESETLKPRVMVLKRQRRG
jgi:REP element-mobilizing transposase RayT